MFVTIIDVCATIFAILSVIDVFSSHSGMGFLDKCAGLVIWIALIIFIRYCIVFVYEVIRDIFKSSDNTIDHAYANEAIKFFDNYLSLCKNHSVIGFCDICCKNYEQGWINTEVTCTITYIDDEHADEEFNQIKNIWLRLRQEKMDAGEYASVTYAGDGYIKDYFGCKDLHYAFTEADEYKFENGQVIMSFENIITKDHKLRPTLEYIKEELLKKWPNANIKVDNSGIIVRS